MEAFIDLLNLYVASCRSHAKKKENDQSTTETVSKESDDHYRDSYELTEDGVNENVVKELTG